MKNKAPLALTELLIMLLVFALAAALCLQAFAKADHISEESARLDAAVTAAQSGAEVLKSCGGDLRRAAAILGGTTDGEHWHMDYETYSLHIAPADSGHPLLGCAEVLALDPRGEVIFTLPVTWQRGVTEHE